MTMSGLEGLQFMNKRKPAGFPVEVISDFHLTPISLIGIVFTVSTLTTLFWGLVLWIAIAALR